MTTHKLIDALVYSVIAILGILFCGIVMGGTMEMADFGFKITGSPSLAVMILLLNFIILVCISTIYSTELDSLSKLSSGFFKKHITDKDITSENTFNIIKNIIKIIILSIATIVLLISCGFFIYNFFIKG